MLNKVSLVSAYLPAVDDHDSQYFDFLNVQFI